MIDTEKCQAAAVGRKGGFNEAFIHFVCVCLPDREGSLSPLNIVLILSLDLGTCHSTSNECVCLCVYGHICITVHV